MIDGGEVDWTPKSNLEASSSLSARSSALLSTSPHTANNASNRRWYGRVITVKVRRRKLIFQLDSYISPKGLGGEDDRYLA